MRSLLRAFSLAAVGLSALLGGCGDAELRPILKRANSASDGGSGSNGGSSAGSSGSGGSGAGGSAGVPTVAGAGGDCDDCGHFPRKPVIVQPLPSDIVERFGPRDGGSPSGGPCLAEPEAGALFPRNLRPLFAWSAGSGPTAVELRLRVDTEENELVVYTPEAQWLMDRALWSTLGEEAAEHPLEVSIRSLDLADPQAMPARGTTVTLSIAPADAPGTIAFTAAGQALRALHVDSPDVVTVIRAQAGRCVGCHTATPGNTFIAFTDAEATDLPDGQLGSLRLILAKDGVTPATIASPVALQLLARAGQHHPTVTGVHWKAGDFRIISLYQQRLIWTDLEAKTADQDVGWGVLERAGDAGKVAAIPQWSHDGKYIVYGSGDGTDGAGIVRHGDIYRTPYNGGLGGAATPIAGAANPDFNEYSPSLSPDDGLVAFARVAGDQSSFLNAAAEVFLAPTNGGAALRLAANDPSACLGTASPGVTNSWPRWAPTGTVSAGRTFYFLAFSSKRTGTSQIYVTPVVRENDGALRTYPAIRLWQQSAAEANYGPSWTNLQLPDGP